jgi:hypothetical protein
MPDGTLIRVYLSVLNVTVLHTRDYARLRSLAEGVDNHLIRWPMSLQHELASKEVWCLTPDLRWAHFNLKKILARLKAEPEKRFRYIVFDNKFKDDQGKTNVAHALENANYIIAEAAKVSEIVERDSIEILFLTNDGSPCIWRPSGHLQLCENNPQKWAYFPIPTDIAVFVNTPSNPGVENSTHTTFAVMSVVPIAEVFESSIDGVSTERKLEFELDPDAPEYLFDIKLQKEEHYAPIKNWFHFEWNNRTRQPKSD